jgi:phosphoribosylformimino-5-aminoimidazole carboxamide ribotide isomerase
MAGEAMYVIPAVDIKGGRCVRLLQGRADRETVFGDDPAAMARRWADGGAPYLHVVDLDGAFEGRPRNMGAVRAMAAGLQIPWDFGGGVRTAEAAGELLDLGADRVVVGTRAVEDPDWFAELVSAHPGRVAAGVDARDGRVAVRGWTDVSETEATELARRLSALDIACVIYTDIARDGMVTGPNVEATRRMVEASRVPVVASGGVSGSEDLEELEKTGCQAVIVGRALYDGAVRLGDLPPRFLRRAP